MRKRSCHIFVSSGKRNAIPTLELTPSPTHQPELSLEEERALLGVKDEYDEVYFGPLIIMYYTQKDENGNEVRRLAWITVGKGSSDNFFIYNRLDREKLYALDYEAKSGKVILESATPVNKRLTDSKIIDIVGIFGISDLYKNIGYKKIGYNNGGIYYELPEEMLYLLTLPYEEQREYSMPMTSFMDLYITCTPKGYRTSWKDFDETLMPDILIPTATISQS